MICMEKHEKRLSSMSAYYKTKRVSTEELDISQDSATDEKLMSYAQVSDVRDQSGVKETQRNSSH